MSSQKRVIRKSIAVSAFLALANASPLIPTNWGTLECSYLPWFSLTDYQKSDKKYLETYNPRAEFDPSEEAITIVGLYFADSHWCQQLAAKQAFKGILELFDRLKLGWNHAFRKHAIVQKVLTPQNYVVVFEKAVPMPDAMTYTNAGIVFCTMKSLPAYIVKVRLAKRGLNLPFRLHYTGPEAEVDCLLLS